MVEQIYREILLYSINLIVTYFIGKLTFQLSEVVCI